MKPTAIDIFNITKRKPAPKPRRYLVTWPCGSTWEIDRHDLEVPSFTDGDQDGITHVYETLKEAIADLPFYGCTVELIKETGQ